jgi:hypothetical protein
MYNILINITNMIDFKIIIKIKDGRLANPLGFIFDFKLFTHLIYNVQRKSRNETFLGQPS